MKIYTITKIIHLSWKLFVGIMSGFHLIKVSVKNKDAFCNLKGCVVIANHPTLIDVVILISLIPNAVCVVKGALAHNFCIKNIIQKAYLVNDDNVENFLHKAENFIAEGFNVIIFPEGTRTNFQTKQNNIYKGFAHIAIRTKAAILPVLITCTPLILGKGQKWYDIGKIRAHYEIMPLPLIIPQKIPVLSEHKQTQELKAAVQDKLFK